MTTKTRNHSAFPDIAKTSNNTHRREKLAKEAPGLAKDVAIDIKHLLENVLKPLQDKNSKHGFVRSFEHVLREVHRVCPAHLNPGSSRLCVSASSAPLAMAAA
jgi:hypothetical protein